MKATLSTRRMFGSGLLILVLAGILGTAMWIWQDLRFELWNRGERGLEGLQVFGTLPNFSFVERSGRTVTLADFRGKVWIANFIYTHCTDTCPLQSARLAALQEDFAGERDLRLVSITVDPARDTPKVLAKYAARYGADPDRWWFLTGEKQAIYALAQQGFYLSVEGPEKPGQPGARKPPAGGSTAFFWDCSGPSRPLPTPISWSPRSFTARGSSWWIGRPGFGDITEATMRKLSDTSGATRAPS